LPTSTTDITTERYYWAKIIVDLNAHAQNVPSLNSSRNEHTLKSEQL